MATIIVRALDANWDTRRGAGLNNFLTDLDAVAQILATRLKLFQGEWFLNLADGTPLFQALLGHPTTTEAVALVLRQRILGTAYVTGINSLLVTYLPQRRSFVFSANVQTQFGGLAISNDAQFGAVVVAATS